MFLGVPRVWEKMETALRTGLDSATGIKGMLGRWARGIGLEGGYALQQGQDVPFGWWLANKAVFDAVKDKIGLDKCRAMVTAAAPVSKSTLEFFLSVGIPIYEVYGMSECCGPQAVSRHGKQQCDSVFLLQLHKKNIVIS